MISAIVLSAGKGSRMKSDIPKQYLKIKDREILYYSLNVFQNCDIIDNIILVTGESDIEFCRENIICKYNLTKVNRICAGGIERYDSVYNGLMAVGSIDYNPELVMIHDGARPFVTEKMIVESVNTARKYGACTVGMPVKDTIKIVDDNNFGINTPNRKYLYQIQTPQTFRYEILLDAYNKMYNCPNRNITDDTMLVEQYSGVKTKVIEGSYENLKITTPEDMEIAEKFLKKVEKTC